MNLSLSFSPPPPGPTPVSGDVKLMDDFSVDEYTRRPLPGVSMEPVSVPSSFSAAAPAAGVAAQVEDKSSAAAEDVSIVRDIIAKYTTSGGAISDQMTAVLSKGRVVAAIQELCQLDQLEVDLAARPVRYSLKPPLTSLEAAMSPEPEKPMYERWFKARIAKEFSVGFDLRICTAAFTPPCGAFRTNNTFGRVIIDFVRSRILCFRSIDETVPVCQVAI